MNPYIYPKTRHTRTSLPPAYRNYRAYKPYLQREFKNRCVYCCQPDGVKGFAAFGVDHYRPQKHFPHLECVYENLFYSCNACNSRKGAFWPSQGSPASRFVPNPCDHVMFEHLRYHGTEVISRTIAGEAAVEILDLNDPVRVKHRELMLHLIELEEAQINRLKRLIQILDGKKKAGSIPETDYLAKRQALDHELTKATANLGLMDGTLPGR